MIEPFESALDEHLAEFEQSLDCECADCEMYESLTIVYGACDHCKREGVKVYENEEQDKWWCVDWHTCIMVEVEPEELEVMV